MDGGFGGLDGERVHHFDGGGEHACGDDAADGGAGFVGAGEGGEEGLHAFGALDDAENHFGGDAESAFGADEDAERDRSRECRDVFPPRWTRVPSGRTTSRPRTWVVVKPYLRQCAPPEFSATLPPMLQTDCEEGSGA